MARHRHHCEYLPRSLYTRDSLQSRSLSPKFRHRHHSRRRSRSPTDYSTRSHSAPRRNHQDRDPDRGRRHHRRESPSPVRGNRHPHRGRHHLRRRHKSLGSLEHRRRRFSRSPSPRRRRPASKGKFTHQLLKILANTASSKQHRHHRKIPEESLYNSWSYLGPSKHQDLSPLLPEPAMVRRSPHHHAGHVHRTRDQIEEERLRKIREEVAEAETRRTIAEEEARRVRRQNELDEAELRRQRALDQMHENERHRREYQLEDRLRHLEDHDLDGGASLKKPSLTKRCCKTFKVIFGIGLTLGLVFVFYLIVATIMGQPTPFDMFNYRPSDLYDKNNEFIVPNISDILKNHKDTDGTIEENFTTVKSDEEVERKDDPYYDVTDNHDMTKGDILDHSNIKENVDEYVDDIPLDMENSGRTMFETYENPPISFSDHFPSVHSVDVDEPEILPPIVNDYPKIEHTSFIETEDNEESYNHNFPSVRRFPTEYEDHFDSNTYDSNTYDSNNFDELEEYGYKRHPSTISPYKHLVPTSLMPFSFKPIPTQRSGLPFPGISRTEGRKISPSIEKLEDEIIDTVRRMGSDQSSGEIRRMLRGPYGINRFPTNRPNLLKRRKGTKAPPTPRLHMRPPRRMSPVGSHSAAPPSVRLPSHRMRPIRPPFRRPNSRYGYRTSSSRILDGSREGLSRGPRNTEFHTAPPEFRYPSSAGSIQDIIDYMTGSDGENDERRRKPTRRSNTGRKRTITKVPSGFKVGRQDHVLKPVFMSKDKGRRSRDGEYKRSRGRPQKKIRKYRVKSKGKVRQRIRHVPFESLAEFESGEDVLFHDDGSISNVESYPHRDSEQHDIEPPTPSLEFFDDSQYEPPVYRAKKKRTERITLDVFPVIKENAAGKKFIKYESKYRPIDDTTNERTSYRPGYQNSVSSAERYDKPYSEEPSRPPRRDESYNYDEEHRDSHRYPSESPRYRADSEEHSISYRPSKTSRGRSSGSSEDSRRKKKPQTITLNINLYSKEPQYGTQTRRSDILDRARREAALEIPLTRQFTILDIYHALMGHIQKEGHDRPFAQFLVADGNGNRENRMVSIFNNQERSSLLQTLEKGLKSINSELPDDVQLQLLETSNGAVTQEMLREAVEDEDFTYTVGFKAVEVEADALSSAESVTVLTVMETTEEAQTEEETTTFRAVKIPAKEVNLLPASSSSSSSSPSSSTVPSTTESSLYRMIQKLVSSTVAAP